MLDREERAKELQREYLRQWRKRNKDKMRKYATNYWLRKAEAERVENEQKAVSENS